MNEAFRSVEANGIAFIGDVHLWSRKPGRRRDENFADTVLRKLGAALDLASSMGLLPVFLGDIFHMPVEPDEAVKGRLLRLLLRQPIVPDANVGNHEIAGSVLAPGDSLSLLVSSGALRAVAHGGGATVVTTPGGMRIGLGFTPYGAEIPDAVDGVFEGDMPVIWVTHHDLGFGGAYPGAADLKEIVGCNLVVNGHMHGRKEMEHVGNTSWFNPGSLTRTSVDQAGHEPTLWVMREEANFQLEPFAIPHRTDVFDLTGRLVAPEKTDLGGASPSEWTSAFAQAMGEDSFDPVALDEATLLEEEILRRFEQEKTPVEVREAVMALLRKVRSPGAAAA